MNVMKKSILWLLMAVFFASCTQVMITGRKQLLLVSDSELATLSAQSYKQFVDSVPASKDSVSLRYVRNTGEKIAAAVESYLKTNGMEYQISNLRWEFSLVKDSTVNAFCMPGGKVVFFEGIMPFAKTETGVAVVMGHEIAHAVARHSNERMSQQLLVVYGAQITDILLNKKSEATRNVINTLYGLGATVGVMLPYSRKHEFEADRLGMIFMAMAGYDPSEAILFWERMAAGKSASAVEFMSTHPSDANRIQQMKVVLEEAKGYYKK
jgi:predicted Zn-dependent protease